MNSLHFAVCAVLAVLAVVNKFIAAADSTPTAHQAVPA